MSGTDRSGTITMETLDRWASALIESREPFYSRHISSREEALELIRLAKIGLGTKAGTAPAVWPYEKPDYTKLTSFLSKGLD